MISVSRVKTKILIGIINCFLSGTHFFGSKRFLLRMCGFEIGKGCRLVGPLYISGKLKVGESTWIGREFSVEGNGEVIIGDNCDLGPDVTILTGSHEIGNTERRAGKGITLRVTIGNGCWIGARSTILGNTEIGNGCIVASGAMVIHSSNNDCLIGGVPARVIRSLEKET